MYLKKIPIRKKNTTAVTVKSFGDSDGMDDLMSQIGTNSLQERTDGMEGMEDEWNDFDEIDIDTAISQIDVEKLEEDACVPIELI